jgi:hypothetical protein
LVAGRNHHDREDQLAADPAGVELIDTRSWTDYVLAPQADSFTVANRLLLVTGARWSGSDNPTGMGLAAYGADGRRRFGLFAGRAVWLDQVANGRAYLWGYGWNKERVIDLRTGRIVGTAAEPPILLLGQGNALG